jgi:lysyl-tRNA synthetase class 2
VPTEDPILFKARVMREFRKLLDADGFIELETPILRLLQGGGLTPRLRLEDGRYLRESPAYALRLNLSLADKIFELGPCFRIDAIDATHLPEFTMLDLYWRNASLAQALSLAERLVRLFYRGPFEELSVASLLQDKLGIDLAEDEKSEERLLQYLNDKYYKPGYSKLKMFDTFVRREIEPLSMGRCLIVKDFPTLAEGRARRKSGTRFIAERAELQIDGVEIVHAYTDEPDPAALIEKAQQSGALEPEDHVMADLLRSGSVPGESAGFGVGVERFCQVCLGMSDISPFMTSKLFSIPGHKPSGPG